MKSPVSRSTRLLAGLATTAAFLSSLAPTAANASDGKDYVALGCRPWLQLQPDPLPDALGGIFNNQSYAASFVCPVIHDEGGSGIASAVAWISTQSRGSAICTLYSASPLGGYRYQSRSLATGAGRRALYFASLAGYTNGVYTLLCNLASGGTLHTYTMNEG